MNHFQELGMVDHLEPWQRGTRSLANNKGMCGGVRGVGTGGVVSSSFCLLYRLHTLKPTKNQIQNTLNHIDSPYIRGIGFMYLRYTLDPKKLWKWFSRYLKDDEPIDVRAGGGNEMTIGQLVRHFLENIEWYDTLFPRIPVPIQKEVRQQLTEYDKKNQQNQKIDKNVINNINVKGFRTRSRSPCKNSRRHYIH
ncbi:hypothetical protein A3Q56_00552 [Intoshia linei]|uniref:Pre-mRNA-splicing factor 38 n=1 Tax=Intoshia linei TaxID=1819745 RepID=A0A177BBF6_9BILA|nr:hypothetical protein A3Q56_00552 [Intoshia linei]